MDSLYEFSVVVSVRYVIYTSSSDREGRRFESSSGGANSDSTIDETTVIRR